ncbi:MAG: hypothetical protein DUD27_00580 [Lachnospiraceae bacterium]|uniref:Uncharacterized protein n=1 Tax=Candidatus Weimeria bifida TaxID=2599074 RepID=A0A6N7J2P8_9FIRM|nr:hypothetical protein [Candidatus Weimeria bifida]RRF97402.1 MAG: hypothetical protein DUD27_00580 [Lachnospiraceae bacterium]
MNPTSLFKIQGAFRKFQEAHPKVVAYFQSVFGSGVPEGTIMELTVTKPGEEPVTTNMRVTQEDLELIQSLRDLQ